MKTLFTIGHSNHPWREFLDLLLFYEITQLVDIRTIPKSRWFPWFNKTKMASALLKEKIAYHHLPELGGLRHAKKDSINKSWENSSFRGYADYMQTPEFFSGLKILNKLIRTNGKTAIMCAEALPWQCHRKLVSDAEVIRKWKVLHIINKNSIKPHVLTDFAKVDRTKKPMKLYYP